MLLRMVLRAVLGNVWAWGLGLDSGWVRVRVLGSSGLGFSEQVAAPTLLLCPVFSHGWRAHHEERWRDERTTSLKRMEYIVMLFNN